MSSLLKHHANWRKVIVMGASAGGNEAFRILLSALPSTYPLPILLVQHLHPSDQGGFAESLNCQTQLSVVTPFDKQRIQSGYVYVAPANYHMLVEPSGHIALTVDPKVNWSRPSIDVLFDSAASSFGSRTIAVLLTGANRDGAVGLKAVLVAGGTTWVQDPAQARCATMPQAAIESQVAQRVMSLEEIASNLIAEGDVYE